MKKLQNDKKRLVDEAMAGYAAAHRDVLEHICRNAHDGAPSP